MTMTNYLQEKKIMQMANGKFSNDANGMVSLFLDVI